MTAMESARQTALRAVHDLPTDDVAEMACALFWYFTHRLGGKIQQGDFDQAVREAEDITIVRVRENTTRETARRCAALAEGSYSLEKPEGIADDYKRGFVTASLAIAFAIRGEFLSQGGRA